VPSKIEPLGQKERAAYEAKRDLAAELLQSVREMKAGYVQVLSSPVSGQASATRVLPLMSNVRPHRLAQEGGSSVDEQAA